MTALSLLTTDAAHAHERIGCWGDLVQRSFGRLRSRTYGASPREWRACGGRIPTSIAKE